MTDNRDRIKLIELRAGNSILAAAGVFVIASVSYWWMETRDGSKYIENYNSPTNIDLNNWFSLELKWTNDPTTGGATLWINGNQIYQINNDDTTNYGNCSQVRLALAEAYNCASTTVYLDNVEISTTQIGTSTTIQQPATEPTTSEDNQSSTDYRHYTRNRHNRG